MPEQSHPETTEPATGQQLANVEKEMTGFELATLRWAKVAVLLSGLAAIFVCAQWWEMHTGGQDTHALAVAAGTQADRTKDLADQMKLQADRTKDIADQAAIQAKASKQLAQNAIDTLRMGYRPWVNAETANLMQPIVFPPKERFFLKVNFVLKNTGTSIATDGLALTEVEPDYTATMTKDFRKACDDTQRMKAAIRQGTPWATGFVLAPGNTLPLPVGMGSDIISNEQVSKGQFYVLGCVLYWDQFKIRHHTKFCFLPSGPITDPSNIKFEVCDGYEEAH